LNAAQQVLNTTLDLAVGRYISQEQANIAAKNAIDQVNQGLADHAGALSLDAGAGRENYNAMLSATQSQLAYSQAILASTGDIGAALVPLQQYRIQLVAWRDQLVAEGNTAGAGLVDQLLARLDGGIAQVQARTPIYNAAGQQIGTAVVTGGADGSSNLGDVILNNVGQAEAGVGGQVPAFDAQGRAIGNATSEGGDAGIKALADFLGNGVLNALNSAGIMGANAHNVGYGIGVKLIDGVGAGMDAESGWLVSKAAGIIDRTVAAMRTAAANASPSKRTRDEVGIPMAQGVAVGLSDGERAIGTAATNTVDAAISAMNTAVSRLGTARRGGGHTYIDFNINVAGVNDDRMARVVGEQLGAGAVDALTRRGIVVKARVG
jgi:hypothetical protein